MRREHGPPDTLVDDILLLELPSHANAPHHRQSKQAQGLHNSSHVLEYARAVYNLRLVTSADMH